MSLDARLPSEGYLRSQKKQDILKMTNKWCKSRIAPVTTVIDDFIKHLWISPLLLAILRWNWKKNTLMAYVWLWKTSEEQHSLSKKFVVSKLQLDVMK